MFYLHGNGLYLDISNWLNADLWPAVHSAGRINSAPAFRLILQPVFIRQFHASLLLSFCREAVTMVPAE
jgi:hypothetical protein